MSYKTSPLIALILIGPGALSHWLDRKNWCYYLIGRPGLNMETASGMVALIVENGTLKPRTVEIRVGSSYPDYRH